MTPLTQEHSAFDLLVKTALPVIDDRRGNLSVVVHFHILGLCLLGSVGDGGTHAICRVVLLGGVILAYLVDGLSHSTTGLGDPVEALSF